MSATDRDDQAGQWAIEVGQPWPGELPTDADGSATHASLMPATFPTVDVVLSADISAAHERSLHDSSSGPVEMAVVIQPHQRTLEGLNAAAYVPVMLVSIYLRSGGQPIHQPLHWITGPMRRELDDLSDFLDSSPEQLADRWKVGLELTVLGRDGMVLCMRRMSLPPITAGQWTLALALALDNGGVPDDVWEGAAGDSWADLMPIAERSQCIRPLTSAAVCTANGFALVGGASVQSYLIENGWLHPQQIGGDE